MMMVAVFVRYLAISVKVGIQAFNGLPRLRTVSYTHLDVYKRQREDWGRFSRRTASVLFFPSLFRKGVTLQWKEL